MAKASVILYSDKVEESVNFYQKLGFELTDKLGNFDWVSLDFRGSKIMISKPNEHLPFETPQFTGSVYFEIKQCEAFWNQVKDWAVVEYPMEDFSYGMREFAVRDNNGYLIQFGEVIEDQKKPKVVGIGGIMIKSKDPLKLYEWYKEILGMNLDKYGTVFVAAKADDSIESTFTQWSLIPEDSPYFYPSEKDCMINYRVNNLLQFVESIKQKGIEILKHDPQPYGLFVQILDPEGNKIELWEPIPEEFEPLIDARILDI